MSIPNLADAMDAQAGKAGLRYLDYLRKSKSFMSAFRSEVFVALAGFGQGLEMKSAP